ncbi:aldehyde dehydrogenase PuuC, partial [Pseudomonas sp. MWU12-2115]|uniref:aldehyde dehydrogenase family protein n=1 Tax=Pseudomonas sp. MWU12-2115 TaxID=2071713 RepID=UPI000DD62BFC
FAKLLMIYAGQSNLKRVWLEDGGKSPNLVFDDCQDLDLAAEKAAFGIFFNQGEVCSANSRLLVQRSIHEQFVERLKAKAGDWRPGNPLDPASRAGAMVDARQTARVMGYIDGAREQGTQFVCGGRQLCIDASDNYTEPTLFTGVSPQMSIARDEVFAPVLSVMPFDDKA